MVVSNINGSLFTALSALNGRTLSTLTAVDGFTITNTPVFPTISSTWMWGEPARETGLVNNDPMPTLTDQSGNGRNFTQATALHKPVYNTNVLNSLAVGTFSGTGFDNKFWTGPTVAGFTAAHMFMVAIGDSASADSGLWSFQGVTGAGSETHYPFSDTNLYDGSFRTARRSLGSPVLAVTSWRVIEVVSTSSEWTFKLSGTQQDTTATNTVGGPSAPEIGQSDDFAGSVASMKGKIAGFYLFNAKLSGTDRTSVITYINTRFGLSSS